jgi:hypothetical protein
MPRLVYRVEMLTVTVLWRQTAGSRTTLSTEYALVPQFIEAAVDVHQ